MGAEAKTDRLEGALLALLEHEERLARWESLPAVAREEAVEQWGGYELVDDLSKAARRFLDPLAGTLRIGLIPTVGPYLLPVAATQLRNELPRLTLAWLEDKTEALVRRIRHGDLDGAFLALESEIGDLSYETIQQDPFVLAVPPDHRLGRSSAPIPFSRLRGERILRLDEGHCFRDQVIEFCSGRGIEELGFRATSVPTLVQMACANMGITVLPLIAVPTEVLRSDLVTRPIERPALHRTVVLAWRRQSALSEAMRTIARIVRHAVQDHAVTEKSAVSGTTGRSADKRHQAP